MNVNLRRLGFDAPPKCRAEIKREALHASNATPCEKQLYEIARRARNVHVIRGVGKEFALYNKAALIGTGSFGRVFGAVDSDGRTIIIKELRRIPARPGGTAVLPTGDRNIGMEFAIAQRFGERLAPLWGAYTATRAYFALAPAHLAANDATGVLCETDDELISGLAERAATDSFGSAQALRRECLVTRVLADTVPQLQRMHNAGYVHNDLKPNNIFFVAGNGAHDASFEIGDFGNSFHFLGGEFKGPSVYFAAPERTVNTPSAMAFFDQPMAALAAADVFSLGLTCILLLVGNEYTENLVPQKFFEDGDDAARHAYEAFENARRGSTLDVMADMPDEARTYAETWSALWRRLRSTAPHYVTLLREMVHRDPSQRPTLVDIQCHAQDHVRRSELPHRDVIKALEAASSHAEMSASLSRRFWQAAVHQGVASKPTRTGTDPMTLWHERRHDITNFAETRNFREAQRLLASPRQAAEAYAQWLIENVGFV